MFCILIFIVNTSLCSTVELLQKLICSFLFSTQRSNSRPVAFKLLTKVCLFRQLWWRGHMADGLRLALTQRGQTSSAISLNKEKLCLAVRWLWPSWQTMSPDKRSSELFWVFMRAGVFVWFWRRFKKSNTGRSFNELPVLFICSDWILHALETESGELHCRCVLWYNTWLSA